MMQQQKHTLRYAHVAVILGVVLLLAAMYVKAHPLSIVEGKWAWIGNSMQLAASTVGMSAAVAPNQYNTLALELQAKDQSLSAREKELVVKELALQKEIELRAAEQNWIIISVGSALFLLIALNFYLDYRRRNQLS